MRKLTVDDDFDYAVSLDVFPVLQLRTENNPWLPRLETFKCEEATDAFIPFIPLLLSPNTTKIKISFSDTSIVVIASTIPRFPKLCPDLKRITLDDLPRDPAITEAVSEMLLTCNRDTLQKFDVDSPLTEEAREVVYRLPRLYSLWTVIQGSTSLPTIILPSITFIDIEYDDNLDWLQGFRGAVLGELGSISFHSEYSHIGDPIGAFESVALTTSAKDTLSEFRFYTSSSGWNPNYSSLLPFNQLKQVEIEFSCVGGCSSKVDDDIIMDMARAMPKLEILQLGDIPCETPTGITVNGLIGLARLCPRLSKLCIHFQATTLVEAATSTTARSPSNSKPVIRREDCALTDLEVGMIPIPAQSGLVIAHILLQIFPRILNVKWYSSEWKAVAETINDFRRIGNFVHHTGEAHP